MLIPTLKSIWWNCKHRKLPIYTCLYRIASTMTERKGRSTLLLKELCSEVPVISWDLDEGLEATQVAVIDCLNEVPGLKKQYKPPIKKWWQITDWLVDHEGWDKDTAMVFEKSLWTDPKVLMKAHPVKGSYMFSLILSDFGIPQHIVTGRDPGLNNVTYGWCKYYYSWIPKDQIHIRDNDHVLPHVYKANKVNQIGAKLHFEDSVVDAVEVLKQTNAYVVSLFHENDRNTVVHPRLIERSGLDEWFFLLQTHQLEESYGHDYSKKIQSILEKAVREGI